MIDKKEHCRLQKMNLFKNLMSSLNKNLFNHKRLKNLNSAEEMNHRFSKKIFRKFAMNNTKKTHVEECDEIDEFIKFSEGSTYLDFFNVHSRINNKNEICDEEWDQKRISPIIIESLTSIEFSSDDIRQSFEQTEDEDKHSKKKIKHVQWDPNLKQCLRPKNSKLNPFGNFCFKFDLLGNFKILVLWDRIWRQYLNNFYTMNMELKELSPTQLIEFINTRKFLFEIVGNLLNEPDTIEHIFVRYIAHPSFLSQLYKIPNAEQYQSSILLHYKRLKFFMFKWLEIECLSWNLNCLFDTDEFEYPDSEGDFKESEFDLEKDDKLVVFLSVTKQLNVYQCKLKNQFRILRSQIKNYH